MPHTGRLPWAEVPRTDSKQTSAVGVTVDTMRKAKGRQWRVVIISGCSDAHIPGPQSMRNGDTESERRMFYVAMTRPSERLIIGYGCRRVDRHCLSYFGREIVGTNGASRFLFESGLVSKPDVPTNTLQRTKSEDIAQSSRPENENAQVEEAPLQRLIIECRACQMVHWPLVKGATLALRSTCQSVVGAQSSTARAPGKAKPQALRQDWDVREGRAKSA